MSGIVKICPNCRTTHPVSQSFCVECGAPLVEQRLQPQPPGQPPPQMQAQPAPQMQVETRQAMPVEAVTRTFDPQRVMSGMARIRVRNGEAHVPSWGAFAEVVQGLKEDVMAVDAVQGQVEALQRQSALLTESLADLRTKLADLRAQQEEHFKQTSDRIEMMNVTLNNLLGDIVTSMSSIGRFVRELEPALTERFREIKLRLDFLVEEQKKLRKEVLTLKGTVDRSAKGGKN